MSADDPGSSKPSDSLGSPDHDRSGRPVDEAVTKAEAGSEVEGLHTPSGQEASGESRAEKMVDEVEVTNTDSEEDAKPDA